MVTKTYKSVTIDTESCKMTLLDPLPTIHSTRDTSWTDDPHIKDTLGQMTHTSRIHLDR